MASSNYLQLNEKDTFSLLLVAIEQLEQLFNPTIQMNSIGHQLNHILEGYRQKLLPFLHKLAFILLLEIQRKRKPPTLHKPLILPRIY